jgi:hypothetical protein
VGKVGRQPNKNVIENTGSKTIISSDALSTGCEPAEDNDLLTELSGDGISAQAGFAKRNWEWS